jgi:hypothetical protein
MREMCEGEAYIVGHDEESQSGGAIPPVNLVEGGALGNLAVADP